jgi:hypothetical protein
VKRLRDNPLRVFLLLCFASVVALAGYFYWVQNRMSHSVTSGNVLSRPTATPPKPLDILFRRTVIDMNYGKLARVSSGDREAAEIITNFSCEVVHFAAGRGVCLKADRGVFTTYAAQFFDSKFQLAATLSLNGIPSRTRTSRDGRLAAITVFVSGHSYASTDFSTQTLLVNAGNGSVLADLEEFKVERNGERISSADFNFWGVTFSPDSRYFYSTLSTNHKHYLIKGDIEARTATVLHENVECPSLSPDGSRIAFKKRLENRPAWRLHVLDLVTMRETALSEERSIDDQLEWLDNDRVLYAVPDASSSATTNVWISVIDNSAPPQLFLRDAYSPAVVR